MSPIVARRAKASTLLRAAKRQLFCFPAWCISCQGTVNILLSVLTVNPRLCGQLRGARGSAKAEGQGAAGRRGASLPPPRDKGASPSLAACPPALGEWIQTPPPSVWNPSKHLDETLTSVKCRAPIWPDVVHMEYLPQIVTALTLINHFL